MMENALTFMTAWEAMLWHGFLVFLRVGAAVTLLPAFGESGLPMRVKLGGALAFTVIIAPAVPAFGSPGPNFPDMVTYALSETFNGMVLGVAVRMFILALQTAGAIAAQSTSLAQLLGGVGEPMPAIGQILRVGALALAVTSGLHVYIARFLIDSYTLFPAGIFPAATMLSEWGVGHVADAFGMAFKLAAPFMLISALYNLMLGVINRAMPQLMVAFVGAPLITFGGLSVLFLTAVPILILWWGALEAFLVNPAEGMK